MRNFFAGLLSGLTGLGGIFNATGVSDGNATHGLRGRQLNLARPVDFTPVGRLDIPIHLIDFPLRPLPPLRKPITQLTRPINTHVQLTPDEIKQIKNTKTVPIAIKFAKLPVFVDSIKTANFDDFKKLDGFRVQNPPAFNAMKNHIINMYSGVKDLASIKTFDLNNVTIDCIPVEQQPSAKLGDCDPNAKPPIHTESDYPGTGDNARGPGKPVYVQTLVGQGEPEDVGIQCQPRTVPIRRLTLEYLSKFPSLEALSYRPPVNITFPKPGFLPVPFSFRTGTGAPRVWAYGQEWIENWGGNTFLNVWNPRGSFSLSQAWYGGIKEDQSQPRSRQFIEGGWMVDDSRGDKAQLFIYYTSDNYKAGSGGYGTEVPGFCQISDKWGIGMPFWSTSIKGGIQFGFDMQWKLTDKKWWLYLKGENQNYTAIGYYPTSLFGDGVLATKSNFLQYGFEVANYGGGTGTWPQMGSGEFPNGRYGKSAFQKNIFYVQPYDIPDLPGAWTNLSATTNGIRNCYGVEVVNDPNGGDWGTYIWAGGPGGQNCINQNA